MEKEILFKAKRIDSKEWVEGFIFKWEPPLVCFKEDVKEKSKWYICRTADFADWNMPREIEFIEVEPDTIREFTGCLDKNKDRIWEHDIVRCTNLNPNKCYGYTEIIGIVEKCAGFHINIQNVDEDYYDYDLYLTTQAYTEIIKREK